MAGLFGGPSLMSAAMTDPQAMQRLMMMQNLSTGLSGIGAALMEGSRYGGRPGRAYTEATQGMISPMQQMQLMQQAQQKKAMQDYLAKATTPSAGDVQTAMAAGGGPTPQAASLLPQKPSLLEQIDPQIAQMFPEQVLGAVLQRQMAPPVNVAPGGTIWDPATREPLYQAPFKPQGARSAIGKLRADRDAGLIDEEQYKTGLDILRKPLVQMGTPKTAIGKVEADLAAGRTTPEEAARQKQKLQAFTGEQSKVAGFANRMTLAEQTMADLTARGYQPGGGVEHGLSALPFGNYMVSDEFQQYRQAQEDWVRAKLRRESGAMIGDQEMASEITTYFPQPGDSEAVKRQKAQARRDATQNLIKESQGAYGEFFGQSRPPQEMRPQFQEGQTATNPQTGERMIYRDGRWVPL